MTDVAAFAYRLIGPRAVTTGAPDSDSLENVNTNPLPDGALCWVSAQEKLYVLRKASTVAADGVEIVAPKAGPGRWMQYAGPATNTYFGTGTGVTVTLGFRPKFIAFFRFLGNGSGVFKTDTMAGDTAMLIAFPPTFGFGAIAAVTITATGFTITAGNPNLDQAGQQVHFVAF